MFMSSTQNIKVIEIGDFMNEEMNPSVSQRFRCSRREGWRVGGQRKILGFGITESVRFTQSVTL